MYAIRQVYSMTAGVAKIREAKLVFKDVLDILAPTTAKPLDSRGWRSRCGLGVALPTEPPLVFGTGGSAF